MNKNSIDDRSGLDLRDQGWHAGPAEIRLSASMFVGLMVFSKVSEADVQAQITAQQACSDTVDTKGKYANESTNRMAFPLLFRRRWRAMQQACRNPSIRLTPLPTANGSILQPIPQIRGCHRINVDANILGEEACKGLKKSALEVAASVFKGEADRQFLGLARPV